MPISDVTVADLPAAVHRATELALEVCDTVADWLTSGFVLFRCADASTETSPSTASAINHFANCFIVFLPGTKPTETLTITRFEPARKPNLFRHCSAAGPAATGSR